MKGDRDPETPVSTPNPQYNPEGSAGRSPFDELATVAEVEAGLVETVLSISSPGVESIALFRVDTYRNCLVGRLAARNGGAEEADSSGWGEISRKIRRVRFSIEDTELGPVGAMIAATIGTEVEDAGTAFETEDPAELVKILGPGLWSYWTVSGVSGPMGVLAILGEFGEQADALDVLVRDAGRALERTEARAEWDRMARQQRRLRDGARTVCTSRNLTELYRRLIRIVARGTSAPWARFLGGTDNEQVLRVLAQCGAIPEAPGFEAALEAEALPAWETLRPRLWSGQTGDAASITTGPVWLIPVQAFDQALGVLAIGRLPDEMAGDMDRDEPFLQTVAAQFALAIRNSQLSEDLRVNRQRLREMQGQLLRSERLSSIGESAAELASQTRPAASSIYATARDLLESMEETDVNASTLDGICRELLRLDALLREQVDLGRLTQPRLVMSELGSMVGECLGAVRDDARLAGIDIVEATGKELPNLLLDHEKVREVVTNLFRTALEGLRRGDQLGVVTQKRGHHLVLEVTATDRSDEVEAKIEDDSIETTDLLSRLFAPFASGQPGGSTLGLAVARQIVVDHGGEFDIHREEGRTLVYRLRLPIRDNGDRRAGKDRRRSDRRRAA